jgi:hypothetical protein
MVFQAFTYEFGAAQFDPLWIFSEQVCIRSFTLTNPVVE